MQQSLVCLLLAIIAGSAASPVATARRATPPPRSRDNDTQPQVTWDRQARELTADQERDEDHEEDPPLAARFSTLLVKPAPDHTAFENGGGRFLHGNGDGHGPLGGSTGDGELEFEAPDFFLYQPPGRDYIAFGHSLSSSDSYFGWSQNRYGWCTDYPENVQESSNARIAQEEFDISDLVGEASSNSQVKPYKDYLTSVHRTQVLFAGGRGAIVRRFVASGTRNVISEDGGALKNIDLDIEAAAMGVDFFVLSGTLRGVQAKREARVYHKAVSATSRYDHTWTLAKTVSAEIANRPRMATAVACNDILIALGDPGDKSVSIYTRQSNETEWFATSLIQFGAHGESQMTSDGTDFGAVLALSSDHVLAVGAYGSTPTLDHTDSPIGNTGSVFIYRLAVSSTLGSAPRIHVQLVGGINPPVDYMHSHLIMTGGLLFGSSLSLSERMDDNNYFLFVGAPGSKGSEVTKGSSFSGGGGAVVAYTVRVPFTGLGTHRFTHWFTGFIGSDDHDTGAAVSYAHSASTLYYGAPSAQNWAGTNPLYGSGRVYIAVFCKENFELYNKFQSSQSKHLKSCRRCAAGMYSHGGRETCQTCQVYCSTHTCADALHASNKPVNADWVEHATCNWACKPGYFGSGCELCSDYRKRIGSGSPANSHWVDGAATCDWACDKHHTLATGSIDKCEAPTLPGAPGSVIVVNALSGSVDVQWSDPVYDLRIALLSFRLRVFHINSSTAPHTEVLSLDQIDRVDTNASWWSYTVRDLLAETKYRFSVQASTAAGFGPASSLSTTVTTGEVTSPSPPRNVSVSMDSISGDSFVATLTRPLDLGGSPLSIVAYALSCCIFVPEAAPRGVPQICTVLRSASWISEDSDNTIPQFSVRGLSAQTQYQVSARAEIGELASAWSAPIVVQTGAPLAPSLPGIPVLGDATSTSLRVKFTSPTRDGGSTISIFRLRIFVCYVRLYHGKNITETTPFAVHDVDAGPFMQRVEPGESPPPVHPKIPDNTTIQVTVPGLRGRTQYRVSVQAVSAAGLASPVSALSIPRFTSQPHTPSVPRSPSVIEIGSSWLLIQWSAPEDDGGALLTSFEIRLIQRVGQVKSSVELKIAPPPLLEGGFYQHRLSPLPASTTYSFEVSAFNALGQSAFSGVSAEETTDKMKAPSPPGRPKLTSSIVPTRGDEISMSWDSPFDSGGSPVLGFDVFVSMDGFTWSGTPDYSVVENELTITGLLVASARWAYIVAKNLAGSSEPSHVSERMVSSSQVSNPRTPTFLAIVSKSASTISAVCGAPFGNGGALLRHYVFTARNSAGDVAGNDRVLAKGTKNRPANATIFGHITGLTPSTNYALDCTVENSEGLASEPRYLDPTGSTVRTLAPSRPSAPVNISVVRDPMDKDGNYNVTWTPPVDTGGVQLSGYFVQYIEQDQTSSPSRITNVSVPAQYLSTKISPTKIDVPLLVRVAAVNILGKGHWKNYQSLLLLNLVIEDPVFTEVSPSNSAIRVSWSMPNAGQYTYKIRAWARDGQDMQVMTTADTVATFRGLLASTEYFVDAVASNQEGYDGARFPWPSSKRTTIVTAPSGPQNVRLVRASSSSITIAWDAPSETHGSINVTYAARCVLEATVSSANTSLNAGSLDYVGSALSTVMSGLSADSEYLCFVRGYNEAGGGPIVRSDITFSTMEASVPGPSSRPKRITLPGVTDVWSGVVVLEWQPPKDDGGIPVREYLVLMSYNGLSFEHLIGRAEIQYVESTVRATITRLSAEKDYYFRVKAINFKGTGAASPPSAVVRTPTAGLPSEPRSLQAFFSPQNSGKVRIAWQDPEFYSGTQTLTYVLERKVLREYEDICSLQKSLSGYTDAEKISGFNAQYDSLDQSELPTWARRSVADFEAGYQRVFKSTNETSGGKLGVVLAENDLLTESQASFLLYRVRAVSAVAGDGPTSPPLLAISPVGVTHQPTAPEIVSNVYTSLHANQVLLSWNMPDLRGCGPAHYVLLRYTKSRSGEWGEEPVRTIVTGSASTSTEVGLQHTTTYRWQIVAVNLAGESLPSEYSDEATTGKSPPTAVCSFSLEATAMDVVLDWSAPCDDGGSEAPYPKYQVQYWRKNYGGNWMHLIVPEGDTQYKHTFDREYFNQEFVFQVRARNLAGYGPWNRSTVRMLEPKVCPGKSRYGSLLPCSGHGTCHDFDGTCKCDYMYSGEACDTPNGVVVLLVIKGSIESFVPNEFRAAIAAELGIAMYRIPPEFMSFVSGSVKVTFSILNEHPVNTTAVTRDALGVIGLLERKMSRGDLVGLGAKSLSIVSVEGATASSSGGTLGPGGGTSSTGYVANGVFSIAPELPSCEVDVSGENPCTSCLAQSGCGWCAKSTTCMVGGERGPALAMGSCDTSDWSFNDDVCPPSAHDVCATHNTCGNCVAEDNAACAWCASSGSCLSENRGSKYCPWGWVPDVCVGSCERNKVMTSVNGILWLGDDTSGSVLQYKPLSDCKWTISPVLGDEESADARQQSYASQSNDFDSITVTFERVDLGYGDTVKVFDGQNELLLELQHSSGDPHVDQMPIEATTKTGIIVVDFLSDNSGSGTGFLAKYEAKPKTFWDMYLVVGFSSISMVACVCCFCCWMRCKPEELGGRQIENSLGLDLQSTDRGATVTNIKKFPRFAFSENHKRVMDDIGQTSACTICLGDYENAEELRLLPCGHCFHAECVDAWLQINRVCPICKVDVYDLLVEESARKQREKKLKKQRKKQKRRREKKKKKKKKLGNHVTPVRSDQDHTRITVKRVPEVLEEEEEEEVLTPMEEFRKRSRRLLIAGSRVHESATTGTSAGEEKLPEIEMSVLSDRPLSPPHEHIRVARAPASLPIGSGVSSAGRQRPIRVSAPRTQQHPRTGSLNDGLTNSRGDGNLEVRARPLPLILSNSFTSASRDRGQRLRLPPAGRLPTLTANAQNISHRNMQNWTVNSQLSSERLEHAAQNSLDATVGAVSDLSIERPRIGHVVNQGQNLPTPVLLTRFQQQSRRRSTINQDDTLLESTF